MICRPYPGFLPFWNRDKRDGHAWRCISRWLRDAKRGFGMRKMFVATHHKSGTMWMLTVFRAVCKSLGMRFVNGQRYHKNPEGCDAKATDAGQDQIIFNPHSTLRPEFFSDDYRVIHLSRDPRDMLVSATHYHLTAKEGWLTWQRYGPNRTQTYQEVLTALPTIEQRLMFELENRSGKTFRGMERWPFGMPTVVELRYEDLIQDHKMTAFDQALSHLGFTQSERQTALAIYWQNSLFGGRAGKVDPAAASSNGHSHIRHGGSGQWRDLFTPEIAQAFSLKHPEILRQYGYETDDMWRSLLKAAA